MDRSHRYNDDERLIARALADLGAIAIQNAFLYDRVFSSEEILRKSERLTTLGTLAAKIAHEITIILSWLFVFYLIHWS